MDPQPWSKAHARCVACGTTDRPHASLGMCQPCYSHRYFLEHKQALSEYFRRYRTADPARHLARVRARRERNHGRYLEQSRKQQRERYWRRKGEQSPADQHTPE